MGLRETIKNAAKMAIAATGNIPILSTYRVKGAVTYNPATGQTTANDTEYDNVPVVHDDNSPYTSIGMMNIPNMVVNENERIFYIAQLDLTPTPKLGDQLIVSGITWDIVDL